MAPKRSAAQPTAPAAPTVGAVPVATTTAAPKAKAATSSSGSTSEWQRIYNSLIDGYAKTPQRIKLIDVFLAFLVVVGIIQFVYCALCTDYPFNSFISGFSVTVAQFVLTASLRIQTIEANKSEFPTVSPERAFADYVFCSFLAHFFAINYIN